MKMTTSTSRRMMTTTRLKNFTEKMRTKKLKIILGPTAVGKTDYSIEAALKYESPVISCDSRQIYKEMSIGTAVPDASQLAAVKHYFIHSHTVTELYTAGKYEIEALELINRLFDEGHDTLVMAGGSGFYVDALVNGLDDFPAADQELRNELMARLKAEGVESLRLELKALDPESYATIDVANGQRVVRALEVCLMTGKPFSSFKTSAVKKRDFEIEKIGLTRPRDVLYDRINRRVINMIDDGLVDEVRSVVQYRDLAALQTVGYKEIFDWFDFLDGKVSTEGWGPTTPGDGPVTSLDRAIELIQRNTRRYAKRQLSYWGRDKEIKWLEI
jgi:tRNA dimethylallyltransferase